MRKLFLFLVIFHIIELNETKAQNNDSNTTKVAFGVRVGMHYGLVKTNEIYFNGAGFRLGGFSDIRISKKSNVRIDINGSFENNYARDKGNFLGISFEYREVSKPFFLEYSIFYLRNFSDHFSLIAGPHLEQLLGGSNTKNVVLNNEQTITKTAIPQRLYLGLGVGVHYQLSDYLSLGFEYAKNVFQFSSQSLTDNRNRFKLNLNCQFK